MLSESTRSCPISDVLVKVEEDSLLLVGRCSKGGYCITKVV
jgi:hypothetical protein